MTEFVRASRRTGPRPAASGLVRLSYLAVVLAAGVAAGCAAPRLPKPLPPSANRRVTPGAAFLARGAPLADSTRLEKSAAVTTLEGRAPIPPHWSPAFRAQARAHADERYVHALTARANGRNNVPVGPGVELEPVIPATAPTVAEPPRAAGPTAPFPGATAARARGHVAPPDGSASVSASLPSPVSRATPPSYTPPSYTPPSYGRPSHAPPAYVRPTVAPASRATDGGGREPFSFASVPAHLRDVAALSAREETLADETSRLGVERRAVLRVAKAIRQHERENSATSRTALDAAFREYESSAVTARGLSLRSGAQAFAAAEPGVRDRLSSVTEDRKAVTRLIVALRTYEASPTAANGAAVTAAVAKYNAR